MEKKLIIAIVLLIAGLLGVGHLITLETGFRGIEEHDMQQKFQEFQWKYGKVYNDIDEESKRFQLFSETYQKIEEFNRVNKDSKVAINQFADLTDEEFESNYLTKFYEKETKQTEYKSVTNRPQVVDWVGTLVWTGVNDQGQCGSCWAFSSTQALEAAYAKEFGKFQLLSVQEVLDCAEGKYGNLGCNGGLYDHVFKWVKEFGGVCPRDQYQKYDATEHKCGEDKCKATKLNIDGWVDVTQENKDAFLDALAMVPLSIAIDANQFAFRYYHSGIIRTDSYRSLDHAVLAVGYNEQKGDESYYIKVKNSWGPKWGEAGYVRLGIKETGKGTLGCYIIPAYPHYKNEPTPGL